MAKRVSDLDRAIHNIDAKIAQLQQVRAALEEVRDAKPVRKRKAKTVAAHQA